MHRLLTAATYVAIVTTLLALLSQSALAATLVTRVTDPAPAAADALPLQLEASTPDLRPGDVTTLVVRVTSTASTENLKITGLQAHVGDAAPGCLAANVEVTDYALAVAGPTYVVEPGATLTVPLAITMLNTDTNQDACKGVTFPINLTGQVVPAV